MEDEKIDLNWARFARRFGLGGLALISGAQAATLPDASGLTVVALVAFAVCAASLALWPVRDERDEIERRFRAFSLMSGSLSVCIMAIIFALITHVSDAEFSRFTPYTYPGLIVLTSICAEMALRFQFAMPADRKAQD